MFQKLKLFMPWAIALTAVLSAVWAWYHPREVRVAGPTQWRDVTKFVTVKPQVACKDGSVTVINPIVSESAQSNPQVAQEPIIAIGGVPASEGGFELKTALSLTTGEAKTLALPKTKPFFAFENEKEVGFVYGKDAFMGYGRWSFARIGGVYLHADLVYVDAHRVIWGAEQTVSAITPGIGLSYRF